MRIVGFGTYDTSVHPRMGVLLDGLRDRGDRILEANAPLGFTTDQRVTMLRRPWLAYRIMVRLIARWMTLTRKAATLKRQDGIDAVLVGYLGHFDVVLARVLFGRRPVVLDCLIFAKETALDRGLAGGARLRVLALIDAIAVRSASVVVVDTAEHLELLPANATGKGVVVAVGAPHAWFAARATSPGPSGGLLRVVFFGSFTPLQGSTTVAEALGQLAGGDGVQATMIGRGQDWDRARQLASGNPNVEWLDWMDPSVLPSVVAAHDVCLGIFGISPKALMVVPNKVYQGAAAGCAVVTSDTAPQRRALGQAARYVPPGDAGALTVVLQQLAADRGTVEHLKKAAAELSSAAFAPGVVVEPLRRRLVEAVGRSATGDLRVSER